MDRIHPSKRSTLNRGQAFRIGIFHSKIVTYPIARVAWNIDCLWVPSNLETARSILAQPQYDLFNLFQTQFSSVSSRLDAFAKGSLYCLHGGLVSQRLEHISSVFMGPLRQGCELECMFCTATHVEGSDFELEILHCFYLFLEFKLDRRVAY